MNDNYPPGFDPRLLDDPTPDEQDSWEDRLEDVIDPELSELTNNNNEQATND